MHYESHIFAYCVALWCVINVGETARSAINPEILANFAKNVATVLSPAVLGDIQYRRNRSSLQSFLTEPLQPDEDDSDDSTLDNVVDNTSNAGSYYRPDPYPYNGLYENSAERLEESEENEQLEESLRDESYLQQERSDFYRPYDFSANRNNAEVAEKSINTANVKPSIGNIEQSSTNIFPSYHGADFPKAGFPGAFLAKPDAGFHGFGPYGHGYHHHHHHHHSYGETSEEAPENGTYHRGYGPPFGGHGYGHPYGSPFPHYGGYGHHDSFYGPYHHNGNNSNRHYGHHGPYHGGPDFYGPPYGHGYGYNRNNNGNNNDNRQTEEPADNGDQNNSTRNGYPHHPYGPPFIKPVGFPIPFNPYHHFHGGFKGGPVVGVGHIGYPLYADPYLIGFPFHPYGPFFHGKRYLPKNKPDSGESGEPTEAPAAEELSENKNPERITALNTEEAAPAPSSNQYKTSGRKGLKLSLINFERKV